ncbi:MAG TPA: ATP-grasp domain-containing protein [Candidatus Dojkabacteria bacterium]|nr:ATP-grasp domain-containing protein [Candidatus Dojkabacteria bacterium]HQF36989.1 ATP-grasp domain-containing protein [Candidatus Dojkabacteria bacterium]
MKFSEQSFVPLLFSGDINCYSMARAFCEEYKVKSIAYGKYYTGPNCNSKIVDYRVNENIETEDEFLKVVNQVADENKDKKIIIVGCGDSYVWLISKLKHQFPSNVLSNYTDFEIIDRITQKHNFYEMCAKYELDFPKTFVYSREMGKDIPHGFQYPIILKASDSVMYWNYKFEGQRKIYKIKDEIQLFEVLDQIYGVGYTSKIIIQDMIPGDDTFMYVLTGYSDSNGKVKLMALGNVLMEEHTPKGLGNHSVVINDVNEELSNKVKLMLEDLGYVGFFNLDVKYDQRDNKFKFFEINVRQGRSNFYVTGAGYNLAKYLIDDLIYKKDLEYLVAKNEYLYTVIPLVLALIFVRNNLYRKKILQLIFRGKVNNPSFFIKDMGFIRSLRFIKTHLSHFRKMTMQ